MTFSFGTSLRSRLLAPLAVMGCVLALVLIASILTYSNHEADRQLLEKEQQTTTIAGYATESLTRRGELQRLASSLGASAEIELVLMTGGLPKRRVLACSRPGWVGAALDSLPLDSITRSALDEAKAEPTFERILRQDGRTIVSLSRLSFQDGGFESGILLVQMDGSELARSFRTTTIGMALGSLCLLFLLLFGIYVLLSRHVLGPISRLARLMRGEEAAPPSSPPAEELAVLEAAWMESRSSVESALHDLKNQKNALDHHAIVSVTDARGVIEYVNDKFCSISGFERHELVGKSHRIVSSGLHSKEFFADFWATIKSGTVWTGKICNKTKAGAYYWVWATVVPLLDLTGKPSGYIALRTDITDQVSKEERLLELNRSLEIQKHLAQDLAKDAEAASVAKGGFLANMSHEIRTPLNGIIGMTNLLLLGELQPDLRKRARIILDCAESLLVLLNDILDFSKIEAGKLDLTDEPFLFPDLVESVAAIFTPKLQEKGLEFRIETQPDVPIAFHGDPGRIRQILVNLVGNAIKFTESGSVLLRTELLQTIDNVAEVRISVRDTGIGIEPSRLDRLFTSFSQVDSSITRKYGGTGLGLAISRNLTHLMGGDMGVESTPGQGSTFWFTACLRTSDASSYFTDLESTLTVANQLDPKAKQRILVADDNEVNRLVCEGILELAGFEIESVEDGELALKAWAEGAFDLILMDMQMPVMDGLTATREIRSREIAQGRKSIPILALTANAMARDFEQCKEAGMDAFVTKPIDPKILLEEIQRALASAGPTSPPFG